MDDHTNNNLDDFFRESLDDDHYHSSDDGWDMPSNQVWNNIESGLVAPVSGLFISRLSAGILSTTAIMLLVVMSYFMYQFQQEVQESKQEIQDLKQIIAQNKALLEDLKTTLLEPKTTNKTNQSLEKNNEINKVAFQKKANEITSTTFSNPSPTNHSKKNHPTFIKKKQQQTPILQQVHQNDKTADFNTQQSSIFTSNNEIFSLFKKQRETISLLNHKHIPQQSSFLAPQIAVLKDNNFLNFNFLSPKNFLNQIFIRQTELTGIMPPVVVKKNKVGGHWSVGVFHAPTWLFQNSNTHDSSPPLPSPNLAENSSSWEYQHSPIGTKLAWHFSPRFSIETGFNYLKVQKNQDIRHRIEYTDDDIQMMQNGDEQVHLAVPFMTDFGNTTIHFEANRDEHNHGGGNPNHSHHEHVNICFETDQTLKLGTIPLFLKYKTRGHKVRLTAKAGIAHQFLLQGQLNLSDIDLKDRDWRLRQQEDFRVIDLKGRINNRWYYTAGIGVETRLNNRVTLVVEPTFTRSMQPISVPNEEKYYPMSFQTDMGLNYYF